MKKIIILLYIISSFCACTRDLAGFNKKSVKLNKQATELFAEQKYDEALELLDKAIELDSSYYQAYSNKVTIYKARKQYNNALAESIKLNAVVPKLGEGLLMTGMLYDITGDRQRADETYQKALEIFSESVNSPNKEKLRNINRLNSAFVRILMEDEKGKEDLKKLLSEIPEDDTLFEIANDLLKKNREELLDDYN